MSASIWAQERAQKIVETWDMYDILMTTAPMGLRELAWLMADAIDAAEEYGEKRVAEPNNESP